MSGGLGAFCFGAVIGYVTYRTLHYKKESVITDIAAVLGAIGGAAVTALFPTSGPRFEWYAVGLAVGFFGYLALSLGLAKYTGLLAPDSKQDPKTFLGDAKPAAGAPPAAGTPPAGGSGTGQAPKPF